MNHNAAGELRINPRTQINTHAFKWQANEPARHALQTYMNIFTENPSSFSESAGSPTDPPKHML